MMLRTIDRLSFFSIVFLFIFLFLSVNMFIRINEHGHINKINFLLLSVVCFNIRKTSPCDLYPLTPHFCIVKLGFIGVYIIFLFLL